MKELGETRRLSLKEVFDSEATEFTPWLSLNLDRLATELGFELEHDDTEVSVGNFRADMRAKATDGRIVVIENQFDRTDHGHLGQILTYAAGIEADVVIWIAERVREEHRAALDWLNDKAEDADFFGVEARVVQIDQSRPAIFWDVVSSPNDWSRTAKQSRLSGQLSETEQLRIDYWTALNRYIEDEGVDLTRFKPTKESWQAGSIGKGTLWLNSVIGIRDKWVRVELYIDGSKSNEWFDALYARRSEVEEALGCELNWDPLEGRRACRISETLQADPTNRSDWANQHRWIVERRMDFERVFGPLVRDLPSA